MSTSVGLTTTLSFIMMQPSSTVALRQVKTPTLQSLASIRQIAKNTLVEIIKLHEQGIAYGKLKLTADETSIDKIEISPTESINPRTTPADDMLSMGQLLYQLNMGVAESDVIKRHQAIIGSNMQRDKNSEDSAHYFSSLITQMLDYLGSRISAQQALYHPFLSDYKHGDKIDDGAYGVVYKATRDGQPVVIKKNLNRNDLVEMFSFVQESKILKQLNTQAKVDGVCVPIIQYLTQYNFKGHYHLVLEYCEGRTLFDYHVHQEKFSLDRIQKIGQQLLHALSFLKAQGVIHADIKSRNLIFKDSKSDQIVLIDFGLAQRVGKIPTQKELQALFYRSPEVFLEVDDYTTAMDMWSLGCVFFEMFTAEFLFGPGREAKYYENHIELLGSYPQDLVAKGTTQNVINNLKTTSAKQTTTLKERITKTDQAKKSDQTLLNLFIDVLQKIMVYDPEKRLTPDQALQHKFFAREVK